MQDGKISVLHLFDSYCPSKVLRDYFEDVYVDKVRFSKKSKVLRIYVDSSHLIHNQYVEQLQDDLYYPAVRIISDAKEIKLNMQYHLSERYRLEDIYEEYKDSLLYEMKQDDPINYILVNGDTWVVADNVITIPMPDTDLARQRNQLIRDFVVNVFNERFHLDVQVGFNYREEDKQALRDAHERRVLEEQKQYQTQLEELHRLEEERLHSGEPNEIRKRDALPATPSMDEKHDAVVKKEAAARSVSERSAASEKKKDVVPAGGRKTSYGRTFHRSQLNSSKDPDVFYGRNTDGEKIPISEIQGEIGEVVLEGQILKLETRELRNEKTLLTFFVTDFTDTISGKVFLEKDDVETFMDLFRQGGFYRIKGVVKYDSFVNDITIGAIIGMKKSSDFRAVRMDQSLDKRVELHMHTTMSDKDSVVDVEAILKRAKAWGHKAIAITDHGVAQAFPIANHVFGDEDDFKIIYGVEGYFVDDLKNLVIRSKGQTFHDTFVVFDIETTGKNKKFHKITEIGAVKITEGRITDRFSQLVNPERPIPYNITRLTGISDDMVADKPKIEEVLPEFLRFCDGAAVVAHNAGFDTGFIGKEAKAQGLAFDNTIVDTLGMAQILLPHLG